MAVAAPHTLLAWMREHRAEMVALLRRLAQEESPSLEPERQRGPFRLLAAELDAIGYGVFDNGAVTAGENLPAPVATNGRSLARCPAASVATPGNAGTRSPLLLGLFKLRSAADAV